MLDYILKNGTVVDGVGSKPVKADIGIKDGKIVKIASGIDVSAKRIIDVSGKIVSPGFIDIHTHSDAYPFHEELTDAKIRQGVTTELAGNCGSSYFCMTDEYYAKKEAENADDPHKEALRSYKQYIDEVNKEGYICNFASLVGHTNIRVGFTGYNDRDPSAEELEAMKALLEKQMQEGCFGMSIGLIYPPSAFAKKEELIELAKVIAKYNGLLAVHMRNEGELVFQAVEEVLEIAEKSGVHLEISHFKITSRVHWGKADKLIKMVADARARGINVTCDQYPFLATSTGLKALLPLWAHDGGVPAIIKNLENPSKELKESVAAIINSRGGAENILIVSANDPQYNGMYLNEVMDKFALSPEDAAIKVLLDSRTVAKAIYFSINEADMLKIMAEKFVGVGSDGSAFHVDGSRKIMPHPRNFGTFPKFFETVRNHSLMSIEDAVYKCTYLNAKNMGLDSKGVLKVGYDADITVFDYENIKNKSEYDNSRVAPEGIDYVFVNGILVLEKGNILTAKAGKALRLLFLKEK